MPQLGESKYIDELNAEAQKSFGKNYVDPYRISKINDYWTGVTSRRLYKPMRSLNFSCYINRKKN